MPELPEVEAARQAIEAHCLGRKIKKSVVANDTKVVDGVSASDFEAAINGKTIVAAHRKGKNMWLQLDSPPFPSFQFGMAGAVYIKGIAVTKYKRSAVKDSEEWPSKYSKLFIQLDDGLEFSFTDKRRFAKVRLLENPVSVPPISELGPDVLLEPMSVDDFWKSLSKKKIGIKALLLDQNFVSGIGNWMADEVLYQARIHPQQSASSMTKENCSTLLNCINEVTNFSVEVGADCLRFPVEWLFHFRWGKKPGNINGKKIEFITAGGRTTAFVPELQKLSGSQAVKELSKPSKDKIEGNADEDVDEPVYKEQPNRKSNVRGRKTTDRSKRPPSNKKSSASVEGSDNDEDDDDAIDNESVKPTSGVKKPSKRKSSPSVEDLENDDDYIDTDGKSSQSSQVAKKPSTGSKPDRNNKNGRDGGKKQTSEKKTRAKTKREDSDDELHNPVESGDEDYDEEASNTTARGKGKKSESSPKKVSSKQQKKKAK